MKKFVYPLAAGLFLLGASQLVSCKKDEKKEDKKSIVGTWTSESAYGKMVKDGVTEFEITLPLVDQIEYTLRSDNTFTATDKTETPAETETGTYSVSGSTLYTTTTAGEKDTTQFELTADNKMIINDNSSYTEDGKAVVETNKITFRRK